MSVKNKIVVAPKWEMYQIRKKWSKNYRYDPTCCRCNTIYGNHYGNLCPDKSGEFSIKITYLPRKEFDELVGNPICMRCGKRLASHFENVCRDRGGHFSVKA